MLFYIYKNIYRYSLEPTTNVLSNNKKIIQKLFLTIFSFFLQHLKSLYISWASFCNDEIQLTKNIAIFRGWGRWVTVRSLSKTLILCFFDTGLEKIIKQTLLSDHAYLSIFYLFVQKPQLAKITLRDRDNTRNLHISLISSLVGFQIQSLK